MTMLRRMGTMSRAEDVQCKDGQYFMTFDKNYKLTGKKKD